MDKKERSREHFAPQHRAEALAPVSLPPSVPEQQLFGLAGLEIGGRADFKRPICGWGVSNFRTEQIVNEEELERLSPI